MLDAIKKDRETIVKEECVVAGRKVKCTANADDQGSDTKIEALEWEQLEAVVKRVVIASVGFIDNNYKEEGRSYQWAIAIRKDLVKLQQCTF